MSFLSALHIAAMYGQAKLIDILIQHGALPDASDFLGCTPLHIASQKGYQNIIVSTDTLKVGSFNFKCIIILLIYFINSQKALFTRK